MIDGPRFFRARLIAGDTDSFFRAIAFWTKGEGTALARRGTLKSGNPVIFILLLETVLPDGPGVNVQDLPSLKIVRLLLGMRFSVCGCDGKIGIDV